MAATSNTKRRRATPLAPAERRRAIIDAVVPLLLEHGPDVSTAQIAAAAGIAEGTIFRVFPDKPSLLWATAEETVNPAGTHAAMAADLVDIADLRGKVIAAVHRVVARSERVMVVMLAMRSALMSESARRHRGTAAPPGPPAFLAEANEALLRDLTELVFKPHRRELRCSPAKAALLLRSLVLGATHPGLFGKRGLETNDIVDAILHGVVRGTS